jgi:sialate O-acetylesterase
VHQNRPANLYNGMIQPLIPYAIRGAIWYQGERNARSPDSGKLYAQQLPTLIADWRTRWDQGDFPFLVVQLPNFQQPQQAPVETSGWVLVREAEWKALRVPNTGLAVTTDVGEAADIHPRNKQVVGERLALWALGTTYGRELTYSGPLYAFSQYRTGRKLENGKLRPGVMVVSFLHADGLKTSDGEPLRGFAVADADRRFFPAEAMLDESGTVTLSSPDVLTPVAARYNWAANPYGNLINAAGLPAAPFRTDKWDE